MKDELCSYYTSSRDITEYMVNSLQLTEQDIVLEPSAGDGEFVDQILRTIKPKQIDALDIDSNIVPVLQRKYKNEDIVKIKKTDTLFDPTLDLFANNGGYYDKIVGNPPYGAWQDFEKRAKLKKKYKGQYVKETYSLFLIRCLSLLKSGGRLSFIIPDTYLFLNLHTKLREQLLTQSKIEDILIFPSNFFPGVSFGYSNLSIVTLEKSNEHNALSNTVSIYKNFTKTNELLNVTKPNSLPTYIKRLDFKQSEILKNEHSRFLLSEKETINILSSKTTKLGDIADVVTGFYSGNNTEFIRVLDTNTKGAKKYKPVSSDLIFEEASLTGVDNVDEAYIPYVKGSPIRKYYRDDNEWFVRWDRSTVDFYKSDKKARFQNSQFYFKTGVGLPMVKSRNLKAFLMKDRVFDQSIVGVFPHEKSRLLYLLALLNSDVINQLIHIINPTANNSANYIKQLPYIEPGESEIKSIDKKVNQILELLINEQSSAAKLVHDDLNVRFSNIYNC